MLRSTLERLTRDVVLRRHLPHAFGGGRLYVTTGGGGLKYLKWHLDHADADVFAIVDEFVSPGKRVWDVGGNMGLFTFAAAFRAGPEGSVLTIEPDVDNVTLLLRSRRVMDPARNARVDILPAALSAAGERVGQLQIAARSRAANALAGFGSTQMGGSRETRAVPLFAADELIATFGPPEVVKIDVEGAELQVLSGANRLLSEARPTLLMEVFEEHGREVADLLHGHRYRVLDAAAARDARVDLPVAPWNCLAVPA
jgi:FkbM family methyltransferase